MTLPVLNQNTVWELVDSLDAAFVLELIDTFLEDSPRLVDELRQGIEGQDQQLVRRAAHTLKANGHTFGLDELARLCQELESTAADGHLSAADETAARAQSAYQQARRALTDVREELSGGQH